MEINYISLYGILNKPGRQVGILMPEKYSIILFIRASMQSSQHSWLKIFYLVSFYGEYKVIICQVQKGKTITTTYHIFQTSIYPSYNFVHLKLIILTCLIEIRLFSPFIIILHVFFYIKFVALHVVVLIFHNLCTYEISCCIVLHVKML